MSKRPLADSTVLVTGGAGFIGSAVVRHLICSTEARVVNLDALTYAGHLESVAPVADDSRYCFEHADIRDAAILQDVFRRRQPDVVLHLAAESHVDRSIDGPSTFVDTNVMGTCRLLGVARDYWHKLPAARKEAFRFLNVSTDEVYGSLGTEGFFTESSPYQPRSPYAASKAAADHLARAWYHTYQFPVIVTNCSNNYGPYQYPEKLIPLMILNACEGRELPVYGRGENVRDWLFVDDHVRALVAVIERGRLGETYNIGGNTEHANLDVVQRICDLLDEQRPRPGGDSHRDLIRFVQDRPGHDFRYAIDASRMRDELGWQPQESFQTGLQRTIDWYLENRAWCEAVQKNVYDRRRLGIGVEHREGEPDA